MLARFFLGMGEAAIAPGFSLITGMFTKEKNNLGKHVEANYCGKI